MPPLNEWIRGERTLGRGDDRVESRRVFRAARIAPFATHELRDFFLGIYRVLTPADGPRARRLSIWLPLHSDV